MYMESPLKRDVCDQLISRVTVAEATYEGYAWVCGSHCG
jgi:hypothetical protein